MVPDSRSVIRKRVLVIGGGVVLSGLLIFGASKFYYKGQDVSISENTKNDEQVSTVLAEKDLAVRQKPEPTKKPEATSVKETRNFEPQLSKESIEAPSYSPETKILANREDKVQEVPPPASSSSPASSTQIAKVSSNTLKDKVEILDNPVLSKLSKCTFGSEGFCQAHLKYFNILKGILEAEKMSPEEKVELEGAFLAAKALFDNTTCTEPAFSLVYSKMTMLEASNAIMTFTDHFFKSDLSKMVRAEENFSLRVYYHSMRFIRIVGGKVDYTGDDAPLTFTDYKNEWPRFVNWIYKVSGIGAIFDNTLQSNILKELDKENPSDERLLEIIKWWQTYKFKPVVEKYAHVHKNYFAVNVCDVLSAKKFALSSLLDIFISDYKSEDAALKQRAQDFYVKTKMADIFGFPATLSELISSYFSPPCFVPVSKAVLGTPPRPLKWASSCYASCYFQTMANFLPLFKGVGGINHPGNGPIVKEHLSIMEKVAEPNSTPICVIPLMSWPPIGKLASPEWLLIRFMYDVRVEELGLNQVLGFCIIRDNKPDNFFPHHRIFLSSAGMTDYSKICMIGQLFVTRIIGNNENYSATDERYFEPIELPSFLNMNVVDSPAKKRFELYAFVMAQIPLHVVSYVRRTNGEWWRCDDLTNINEVVLKDKVPITVGQQKITSPKEKPIMAFYLRVEP